MRKNGQHKQSRTAFPVASNVVLTDGVPALIGGFTAAAAAGIGGGPALLIGAAAGAVMALARKSNKPD